MDLVSDTPTPSPVSATKTGIPYEYDAIAYKSFRRQVDNKVLFEAGPGHLHDNLLTFIKAELDLQAVLDLQFIVNLVPTKGNGVYYEFPTAGADVGELLRELLPPGVSAPTIDSAVTGMCEPASAHHSLPRQLDQNAS